MLSLAETQAAFRAAISGQPPAPQLMLVAPTAQSGRLAIYQRHFRESFRRHLRGRFPTLEWLIGTERMLTLADATLRSAPPRAPSLAAYGRELIGVLDAGLGELPAYLVDVARLDWELGRISVDITHEPLPIAALASVPPEALGDVTLALQPGVAFLASRWPVDALVHLHLGQEARDSFVLPDMPVWLQLNGARGQFAIARLDHASFVFRQSLVSRTPLGLAAEAALAIDPAFDISRALATLFAEALVTTISPGVAP